MIATVLAVWFGSLTVGTAWRWWVTRNRPVTQLEEIRRVGR